MYVDFYHRQNGWTAHALASFKENSEVVEALEEAAGASRHSEA